MTKIRVLIADDHALVRAGLSTVLGFEDDIEVAGEASNGRKAIDAARTLKPDVIIMDLMMPVLNGVDATAQIMSDTPDAKVLILTTYGEAEDIRRALDAGATSAIMKTASNAMLVSAIRRTAKGVKVLSPEISTTLSTSPINAELTDRQMDILTLTVRGLTNKDIATQFGITPSGVKRQLSAVFAKLGAANRSEAVAIALRKQLVKI